MTSDSNQNMNMASQQKVDVDSLLPSIPNHWINIYEDKLIPTNSRQTNKFPERDEQQKGLMESRRQQEYLECINNSIGIHDNEISTLKTDYPPINTNLNETNRDIEMRNKQNCETQKQRVLMASDSQSQTNNIASMEHVLSQNFMIDNSCMNIPPKDDACSESVESQGLLNVNTMLHAFRNSIDSSFIGSYGIGQSVDSNVTNLTSPPISEGTLAKEYPIREQNDTLVYLNNREERQFFSMEIEERNLKLAEKANILRTNYTNQNAASNLAPNFVPSLDTDGPQAYLHVDPNSKRPFRCGICTKAFSQKAHLSAHIRTHTGDKPFSCDSCPMKFSQQSTLKRHRRIHAHEKPYQCKDCGKAFTQKNTLKLHANVHKGHFRTFFKCGNCDKTFWSKSSLQKHRKNTGH